MCIVKNNQSRLLLDEKPLQVLPGLAVAIGLNEAIVLQQINFLIKGNEEKGINFHDGYYWTYSSAKKWKDVFPWWSVATIKRVIASLEAKKLLVAGNYNKLQIDRTKWYRICYDALSHFDTMDCINLLRPLPYNKTYRKKRVYKNDDVSMVRLASQQAKTLADNDLIDDVKGITKKEKEKQKKLLKYNYT